MMKTSQAGIALIKKYEGCRLMAYQDVVKVWTIGYGHTGPDVHPGMHITQEQAEAMLVDRLHREFEPGVSAAIGTASTTQGEFDAMVSLAYNIGVGAFKRSSVLRFHLIQHYEEAADAFLVWNKAGGRVLTGLTRRRQEESDLYFNSYNDDPTQEESP